MPDKPSRVILGSTKEAKVVPDEVIEELRQRTKGGAVCVICNRPFTEDNPDFGGGVCRQCWARSH